MIKFWSYKEEYNKYGKFFLKEVNKTLKKGNIFFGEQLKKFEKNFIRLNKSKYGVAVGSGTDALLISLKTLNLKKSDEVITAANTAIPTISAIINAGGTPRLVDVGEDYLIDINKIQEQINKKTKCIIAVHLYGQMCNMDAITKIAKKNNLTLIEDCAQSQGAKYKNQYSGTIGKFGCFSFYPTKILGAYGDGGFILTNDFKAFRQIKRLRFYGIETEGNSKFKNQYYAIENGLNSRLDEIQATILNLKLKKTNLYIKRRREIANKYIKKLDKTNLKLPIENKNCKHSYHLFTINHPKAKIIKKKLKRQKIETRTIYPFPINEMRAYKYLGTHENKFKNTKKFANQIFSLPLYPELKNSEINKICYNLKKIIEEL